MSEPDRSASLADELFGGSADPAATGPIRRVAQDAPSSQQDSPQQDSPQQDSSRQNSAPRKSAGPRAPGGHRRAPVPGTVRRWAGRGAKVVAPIVLVLAVTGVWAWSGPEVIPGRASPADPALTDQAVAGRAVPGLDLAVRATRTDTNCAEHSYGRVRDFLAAHPCRSVRRALYVGSDAGQPVVVSVATVEMASEPDAVQLQKLADTNGTGNVSDLLREGVTVAGAPARLGDASYASRRQGPVLVIAEAATASGTTRPLDTLVTAALALGG